MSASAASCTAALKGMVALLTSYLPPREPNRFDFGHQPIEPLLLPVTCCMRFVCFLLRDAEQIEARNVKTWGPRHASYG